MLTGILQPGLSSYMKISKAEWSRTLLIRNVLPFMNSCYRSYNLGDTFIILLDHNSGTRNSNSNYFGKVPMSL